LLAGKMVIPRPWLNSWSAGSKRREIFVQNGHFRNPVGIFRNPVGIFRKLKHGCPR